jgi:hypothetical protein
MSTGVTNPTSGIGHSLSAKQKAPALRGAEASYSDWDLSLGSAKSREAALLYLVILFRQSSIRGVMQMEWDGMSCKSGQSL